MKKLSISMLFVLALLWGCKKDEPIVDPDNSNTPKTGVAFTCRDSLGGLEGIIVNIAPEGSACNTGSYTGSADTGANGKIEFTGLTPQDYCYRCTRTLIGSNIVRNGWFMVFPDSMNKVIVEF